MKNEEVEMKKSNAKRVNRIIKRYKKWYGKEDTLAGFKEPVMYFIRDNQKVEFYEDVTSGRFDFVHSDGTERFCLVSQMKLLTFPYGKDIYKGYIAYENSPTAYPDNPGQTAELMMINHQKTLSDMKEWNLKHRKQTNTQVMTYIKGIIAIIGVIGGLIILAGLFGIPLPWEDKAVPVAQKVVEAGKTVAQNVSRFG